jgi:acetyl-CoA carboxylase biotin carboxylase subunit
MFRKILIANRGEIALRIIWACKELGIQTVAVHSDVDKDSLHVRFADEDVCIGPARNADSYLNISAVISAAEITDADAIHPGYGFLAESAHFAEVCQECHLTFIGPSAEVIRLMGDKAMARKTMAEAGVPVLPGSEGAVSDASDVAQIVSEVGYPVIIKASAGGGGRGMRVVRSEEDLEKSLETAMAEAGSSFGVSDVYVEKYLESPRHIEFQLLGDRFGNLIHLNERECSIQRRHQKLVEEAPSTALSPALREKMAAAALAGARKVGYANAGTVEFLLDEKRNFYFMEMNTRIQVEHPVTENITGIDLIKEQIRIAAGEPLPYRQEDIRIIGHSIECRVNAEDPVKFTPSPGKIRTFHVPGGPGVRVDTAAHQDCTILPYYDSMIAKLIVRGNSRTEAISRMKRALDSFVIEGINHNIPLQQRIIADPDFERGELSTHFMDRFTSRKPVSEAPEKQGEERERQAAG